MKKRINRRWFLLCCYNLYYTGPECIDSSTFLVEIYPTKENGTIYVVEPGDTVNFGCFPSFEATSPLWEINSEIYRVTRLPSSFKATGSNITIPIWEETTVRCIYKKFIDGSIADVCSSIATAMPYNSHGMLLKYYIKPLVQLCYIVAIRI